jgi:superoxide oxidase
MPLFNTKQQFGFFTKLLHWSIFLLMSAQFAIIYKREYLPKDAPEKLQYILWHKSFGVIVLYLAIFMLISRYIGHRPLFPKTMPPAHQKATKYGHAALYLVMFLMPISGYLMSTFSGYAVSVFGWYDLPKLFAVNKQFASLCFEIHRFTSYAILALVGGHILASLYHHFFLKDNVLKRMRLFG